MGKVKQANGKAAKASKPLSAVKNAGVTKATDSPKAKSKQIAKDVASKAVKGKDLKKKKVESESEDSESDSDSNDSGSDDASGSSDEDSDDSASESEEEKPAAKAKANGKAAKPVANGKTNGKAKAKAAKSESEDSSDSDEDSDDSDAAADAKPTADKAKKESSAKDSDDSDSSDSSDAEEGSDDSSDADSEAEKKPEQPKKRKAEEETSTPFKKTKTDEESEEKSSTLFVGNLGWAVDDEKLYDAFKDCADLTNARVVTDKAMQRSRGFGYVDFANPEAAQAAFDKMNGVELDNRPMRLDPSKPRPAEDATPNARAADRARQHGDVASPESDTLFVGNLPWDVDEEMVTAFFGEVSEVKSVRLPTDPDSGNRKGFGYVSFQSVEDAKTVYDAKNGAYIGEGRNSRAVRLDFASQRPPRDGNSGGRGGGGFGGRGGGGRGGGRGRGGFGGRGGGGGGFGGRGGGGRGGFGSRGGASFQGKKTTF
ncbi:hypothetical protein F4813DRAFT_390364 [Daldinia decipiens]|uniref:uncharacterized protein n=1 Tax=Daldinia decipiens TaxID=326647 RepID=UPI0020C4CA87|nr:uncharacterized protein F4813DRAFT_390364 [Daldinia decipiens]KAI1656656.1 hypothetical protein F4813DRAFT_390364 [Daldinia decipiens]